MRHMGLVRLLIPSVLAFAVFHQAFAQSEVVVVPGPLRNFTRYSGVPDSLLLQVAASIEAFRRASGRRSAYELTELRHDFEKVLNLAHSVLAELYPADSETESFKIRFNRLLYQASRVSSRNRGLLGAFASIHELADLRYVSSRLFTDLSIESLQLMLNEIMQGKFEPTGSGFHYYGLRVDPLTECKRVTNFRQFLVAFLYLAHPYRHGGATLLGGIETVHSDIQSSVAFEAIYQGYGVLEGSEQSVFDVEAIQSLDAGRRAIRAMRDHLEHPIARSLMPTAESLFEDCKSELSSDFAPIPITAYRVM